MSDACAGSLRAVGATAALLARRGRRGVAAERAVVARSGRADREARRAVRAAAGRRRSMVDDSSGGHAARRGRGVHPDRPDGPDDRLLPRLRAEPGLLALPAPRPAAPWAGWCSGTSAATADPPASLAETNTHRPARRRPVRGPRSSSRRPGPIVLVGPLDGRHDDHGAGARPPGALRRPRPRGRAAEHLAGWPARRAVGPSRVRGPPAAPDPARHGRGAAAQRRLRRAGPGACQRPEPGVHQALLVRLGGVPGAGRTSPTGCSARRPIDVISEFLPALQQHERQAGAADAGRGALAGHGRRRRTA